MRHDELVYGSVNQRVVDAIPTDAKSILDIGCGNGSLVRILKQRQPCRCVGMTSPHGKTDVPQAYFAATALCNDPGTVMMSEFSASILVAYPTMSHSRSKAELIILI
jgi:hypothetical protein